MTSQTKKLLEQVLALPKDERLYLVGALQDSLEPMESQEDIDAAWKEEIARRLRGIRDGSAVLVSGEEVDRELAQVLEEG